MHLALAFSLAVLLILFHNSGNVKLIDESQEECFAFEMHQSE